MEYHWLMPLAAAVANVFLAILVHRKASPSPIKEVFTFLAVTLVFWNLIYLTFYSVRDIELASRLGSVFRAGGLYLFPAILHLCVALPARRRSAFSGAAVVANYIVATAFVAANAMGLLVTRLHWVGWGYYSVGTTLYDAFSIYVLLNFSGAFVLLLYELRTSTAPRTRLQLKFWLLALAVSLPLGLTNLLPVYGIEIYPIGNLGSAAWAAVVAYAIIRHRLMDIELAVTKGLAYVAVVIGVIGPALIISIWMQRWAFGYINTDFTAGVFALLCAVGFLFPLGKVILELRIQESLFAQKREARAMLTDFSRAVLTILDRERLVTELCTTISDGLNLESTSVFLRDESRDRFVAANTVGLAPAHHNFENIDPFIEWLRLQNGAVLAEESIEHRKGDSRIGDVFLRNSWHVCMPLLASHSFLGFVALGKKRNLDAFSTGDLDTLSGLAGQASVALENARLYDELRKSEEIINRTDRLSALGTLAAGIAHEIRNPLVSIQTFFQLAPERWGDEEFRDSFLELAAGEVSRIRDLVGELLSYAKSTTPCIREVNVCDALSRVSTLMVPHARKRQINILCEDCDSSVVVEADGDQLTQVLVNLVLNAVQAAPEGGVVRVSAKAGTGRESHLCCIRVEDDGPGVPEDLRGAIFNPFFTTKDTGTGLGLAIAHRIVTDYGGYIRVGSRHIGGGIFEVLLPRSLAATRMVS